MRTSVISNVSARDVAPIHNFPAQEWESLDRIGISFGGPETIHSMMSSPTLTRIMGHAFDALQPTVTTASIGTPVQFLQFFAPGFVRVATGARKIDLLTGISIMGSWEEYEVVQAILENTGTSLPYGDYANLPFSSYNVNFERQTIVRFEEGMLVGILEQETAAKMRVDTAAEKRIAAMLALEIKRNAVGFVGYNDGNNRTYGYLNYPGLPAYVNVPNGSSGSPLWANKTTLEIIRDILSAAAALQNGSQDLIDPQKTRMTLAVATATRQFLAQPTELGFSVLKWLSDNYPNIRVESAPQLNAANGGANVFYLYADTFEDSSTDGGNIFMQMVQTKFRMLGVQQHVKGYQEGYTNATAGVMCKRPWAVVRRSGI